MYHDPVLLEEVISTLKIQKNQKYIDCTLGDGGHTIEILKKGGKVLGLDVSEESLTRATARITELGLESNFTGVLGNFRKLDEIASENGFGEVSGILYDLGYSSYQMDESEIGLSFQKDLALDMRLDKNLGVTAADLVNSLPEKALSKLIFDYSGEKFAKKIARKIIEVRDLKKIQTTKQLAELIASVTPPGYEHGRINPATRSFQALRIAVNDEIGNLEESLPRAARLMLPGSKILVISFHSLEDKVAKNFGRCARPHLRQVVEKPIVPSDQEIANNPRSRSAKMRRL